ncbi:MAG: hypothetical protein HZA90_05130 [Verrucomicrobia bacterium]|nr:hypothetical protein [Verrucomicrobiota bacterium]
MKPILLIPSLVLLGLSLATHGAQQKTAENTFSVTLPPPAFATNLLPESPFGINTAFGPDTADLDARLRSMQDAGIKWGRQDFTWFRIEKTKDEYDWNGYDRLVEQCHRRGMLLFGNLCHYPKFHDMRTEEGVAAYAAFARTAARRYAGKVNHWQIWNEPNLGYLGGDAAHYARLLAASGKAIHEANPKAKVLGLNMAFADVLWAEKVMKLVPNDCFDVLCFHPYRNPNAPEDSFDWWVQDQYVKVFHKELTTNFPLVRMSFLEQAAALKKVTEQFGPAKPLWVTEMCFNTHIHPYGVNELRSADLLVRFHALAIASRQIEKVFWWTLKDGGWQQFDAAEMVGLARADLTPKYAWHAYAFMTRMLEGRKWVRNDAFGPDLFACVFTDETKGEDVIVAWTPKPFAYIRVNNTEAGLDIFDVFGTKRHVTYNKVRTGSLPVPLGESPVYIVGPKGLKARVRPDPGW